MLTRLLSRIPLLLFPNPLPTHPLPLQIRHPRTIPIARHRPHSRTLPALPIRNLIPLPLTIPRRRRQRQPLPLHRRMRTRIEMDLVRIAMKLVTRAIALAGETTHGIMRICHEQARRGPKARTRRGLRVGGNGVAFAGGAGTGGRLLRGEHGVMAFGFVEMRLFDEARDEGVVGFFEGFAHEGRYEDVAAHIDVLSQPQPFPGYAQPHLYALAEFSGEGAAERPFVFDAEPEGGVDVRLHAEWEVVETDVVGDAAGVETAGEVRDFVGEGVPLGVELFGGGGGGGFDGVTLLDEGLEIDHFDVVVQGGEDGGAGDAWGKGGDGGKEGAFGHVGGG